MDGRPIGAQELARHDLFQGLGDASLELILTSGTVRTVPAGTTLFGEGETGDHCCFVLDGKIVVTVHGVTVGEVGAGECVGELAVLDGAVRAATAVTATECVLLELASDVFLELLDRVPALHTRLTRTITRRLRDTNMGWGGLASDPDVLLEALLQLQSSSDPELARRAVEQARQLVARVAADQPTATVDPLAALTPGERRVAELVAEGLPNSEIAERLFISRNTVETHLKHAYSKLQLRSRVDLATLVLRAAR